MVPAGCLIRLYAHRTPGGHASPDDLRDDALAALHDDDDDVIIFTCAPGWGHMTHGEIYYVVTVRDS